MSFTESIKSVLITNYAKFSGRARRSEYWWFYLFNFIVGLILGFIGVKALSTVYELIILIPSLAVTVRRLHDTGRSGWLVIVPILVTVLAVVIGIMMNSIAGIWIMYLMILAVCIVYIVWLCQDSQKGENEYGPNPKEIQAEPESEETKTE